MIYFVEFCRLHGAAICTAARACGCDSDEAVRQFVADALASGLYTPIHAYYAAGGCPACDYLYPDQAIDDAVSGALALRKQHGVRARLN
jgi:hypothetical protein